MTDDQMPTQPAVVDADGPERPAEGTAQGEPPGGAEGRVQRTEVTSVRLDPEVVVQLREIANRSECTVSELLRTGAQMVLAEPNRMQIAWLTPLYVTGPNLTVTVPSAELDELRAKLRNPVVAAVVQLVEDGQHQHRRAEAAHDLKDEANNRWLEVVAERKGLRGKVEAVRALCDAAEDNDDPVATLSGEMKWYLSTADIRKALDGGQ
jgi:hypothetical protein